MPKVCFRVDASYRMGTGHVMRCLSLADQLSQLGAEVRFICRAFPGNLMGVIAGRGFRVVSLGSADEKGADRDGRGYESWLGSSAREDAQATLDAIGSDLHPEWLVVDHYAIGAEWERTVGAAVGRILVIDDLADREHHCDMLLDQTLGRRASDYIARVPPSARLLLGTDYALLRSEFRRHRGFSLARRRYKKGIKRILISMGGADPDDYTGAVLKAVGSRPGLRRLGVDVLLGRTAMNAQNVRRLHRLLGLRGRVVVGSRSVAALISEADLVVGAPGTSAWERCALGAPQALVVTAENQRANLAALTRRGAAVELAAGNAAARGFSEILAERLEPLVSDELGLRRQRFKASRLVDGRGAIRVAREMAGTQAAANEGVSLRPVHESDVPVIFEWQTDPETRRYFRNPESPTWQQHESWWVKRLVRGDAVSLIVEARGCAVGLLRLDPIPGDDGLEVSVLIAPRHKGRGIAKEALRQLIGRYSDKRLVAYVASENRASQRLFESAGFARRGEEKFIRAGASGGHHR